MRRTVVTISITFLCCAIINSCVKLPSEPVAPESPPIPVLQWPRDSVSVDIRDTTGLEFRWAAVAGVDSYQVRAALDTNFTRPLAVNVRVKATAFKPRGRLTTTLYYWQVRAIGGNENWTPFWRVTIVRPRIEVDTTTLAFDPRSVKTTEPGIKTIAVNYEQTGVGKVLVDSLVVLPADSNFSVETKIQAGVPPLSFEPGSAKYQVKVRFHPQSRGIKTARVLIKSNDLQYPRVYVNLKGTGFDPPLKAFVNDELVADLFKFDDVNVGALLWRDFVMLNRGTDELLVDNVQVFGNSFFSLQQLSRSLPYRMPSRYNNVEPRIEAMIKFAPLQAGVEVEGSLRIAYRYKNENILRIIRLAGKGI